MKSDSTSKRDQLGWRMPIYAALAAVLVFLPLVISSNADVLYLFVIVPGLVVIGICVLIYAAIRKKLSIAVMVATFCTVSAVVFLYNFQIRTCSRWFLWSGQYKNKVLAEPTPVNGRLEAHRMGWLGMGRSRLLGFSCFRSHGFAFRTGPRQSIRQT
jgi:hypothetical protein